MKDLSNLLRDVKVERRSIDALTPRPTNPRTHTRRQIAMIAKSLEEFGWTNPIIVDESGVVIAGHARLEAAKSLGFRSVPVVEIGDMTEAQKRAYVIADNQLAAIAGWDRDLLKAEFEFLLEANVDFEFEVTGFETTEIDRLMSFTIESAEEEEETVPAAPDDPVSITGDLWTIGGHRLICGDARDPAVWDALLDGETGAMAFTDPPYNVVIDGNVSGLGAARHGEFAMASGEMSVDQFEAFLRESLGNLARCAADGALHFVCMDWRHMGELLRAGGEAYSEHKNLCVWAKTNAGMGSFYRSQHELVFVFKSGTGPHRNNVRLGATGRHRSNLWTYPGANVFRPGRDADLAAHPTVKPTAMVADAILDCTRPGDLVLDAFAGSGATLLAAERTGRRAAAVEIDPRYVDLALMRLAEATGETPRLPDGLSFDDAERRRTSKTFVTEENG